MTVDLREPLSQRLGVLGWEQLQAALDRFALGRLAEVEVAPGGLFGQNLFLTTGAGGVGEQWVFRGAPHWPWQFSKERFFAERIHRTTRAPVPWPYYVERDEALFGWSYAIMRRLPGISPAVVRDGGDRAAWRRVVVAMAEGLAELHRHTAPAPGEYDPDGRPDGGVLAEPSFERWVVRSLEAKRDAGLSAGGVFEAEDVAYIDALIADHRAALSVPFAPSFVHYDFKEGNLHVEKTANSWRLSGVFDLMTGAYGDGEEDLSRMTAGLAGAGEEPARAFLDAYAKQHPLRSGAAERFRLYMLMDRLSIWLYARANDVWFPPEARFRRFARGGIDLSRLLEK